MQTNIYKLSRKLTPIATALLLALSSYSMAAEKKDDHDHEVEQHSSHEHGAARLTVAVIDDGLEIALESPAANVFGFEYKATSEKDLKTAHEALEKLEDGAALFVVNEAAACSLENAKIKSSVAEDDDHAHEKAEKHDDHDKEERHDDDHKDDDHEKKEKHGDGHKGEKNHDHDKAEKGHDDHEEGHKDHDDHEDEGGHSDVDAAWTFSCDKPEAINSVEVKLFSHFPKGFTELDVEWITANAAGAVELEDDGAIKFSQ